MASKKSDDLPVTTMTATSKQRPKRTQRNFQLQHQRRNDVKTARKTGTYAMNATNWRTNVSANKVVMHLSDRRVIIATKLVILQKSFTTIQIVKTKWINRITSHRTNQQITHNQNRSLNSHHHKI